MKKSSQVILKLWIRNLMETWMLWSTMPHKSMYLRVIPVIRMKLDNPEIVIMEIYYRPAWILRENVGTYLNSTHVSQFDQSGSYTKLLCRSWKFHQLCILSSTIQWCYPKYWKSLCHFDPCLSMSIIIKIINFIE